MQNDNLETLQERQRQWASLKEPVQIDGSYYLIAPNDFQFKNVTDEIKSQEEITAKVVLHDVDSFVSYMNKYQEDFSTVFIDTDLHTVKGVIDYHHHARKAYCLHTVHYEPSMSQDWIDWKSNDKRKMSQIDFALFIEEQIESITEPSGAEMLEIATQFKVIRKAQFSKGVNLSSGEVQFTFSNQNEKGTINVPGEFKIVLPVFEYGDHYELTARLRYRLNDEQLSLWYELRRPDRAEDKALESIREALKKGLDENIFLLKGTV